MSSGTKKHPKGACPQCPRAPGETFGLAGGLEGQLDTLDGVCGGMSGGLRG